MWIFHFGGVVGGGGGHWGEGRGGGTLALSAQFLPPPLSGFSGSASGICSFTNKNKTKQKKAVKNICSCTGFKTKCRLEIIKSSPVKPLIYLGLS